MHETVKYCSNICLSCVCKQSEQIANKLRKNSSLPKPKKHDREWRQ